MRKDCVLHSLPDSARSTRQPQPPARMPGRAQQQKAVFPIAVSLCTSRCGRQISTTQRKRATQKRQPPCLRCAMDACALPRGCNLPHSTTGWSLATAEPSIMRAQEGCEPNGRDSRGITPLGVAVGFNRLSVVKVAICWTFRRHSATLMCLMARQHSACDAVSSGPRRILLLLLAMPSCACRRDNPATGPAMAKCNHQLLEAHRQGCQVQAVARLASCCLTLAAL
jgi:hypothetical protein